MGLGVEVASLHATLGIDDSQFNNKLNTADSKMRTFGNSMDDVKSKWSDFGRQAQMAAIPIGLALGKGIADASAFESAMNEISARTGVVGEDMDAVRNKALQLGQDTFFSAQDAANGMLELMASGDNLTQAMERIDQVMLLATVGGIDLKRSADGVTDVMAAMRLELGDTADVVDTLSRASSSSSATVSMMLDAMAGGGNIAANYNIGLKDTAATMAIFAENNIKGTEAGTALKSMLLAMTDRTERSEKAWSTLGTSMYTAEGGYRDFNTVLKEMFVALDTKTPEEQNAIMKDLAGSYGITAISALRAQGGIEQMRNAMDSQRSAVEIADSKLDTFAFAMDALGGSIQNMNILAFTPFMEDVLKPIVKDFTEVINQVGIFASKNPELTNTVLTLAAAFVGGTGALTGLGMAVSVVKSGIGALIATALSPLGLAIVLGGGMVAAYKNNWFGFADLIDNVVAPALRNVQTIIQGLQNGSWTPQDVLNAAGGAISNEMRTVQDSHNKSYANQFKASHIGAGGAFQSALALANAGGAAGVTLLNQSSNQGAVNVTVQTNATNGRQIGQDIQRELIRGGVR